MNKTWVKVVAIILAVVLAGSVCVAAVYAFAATPVTSAAPIVVTGEGRMLTVLIVVAVVAVAAILVSVLLPKLKKKK